MRRYWRQLAVLVLVGCLTTLALAQRRGRFREREYRAGVPEWVVEPAFRKDVFTFVRVRYSSFDSGRYGGWGGGWERWRIDAPDADLNFSFRLQQLTSLTVEPNPKDLELTDPELFDYPFIYIVEPGYLVFSEDEVKALRRYLLSGGFLMVDDFWGEEEWDNFYRELKRVFPEREPVELPLEHPIFHCVFDLKERPQIPNVDLGTRSQIPSSGLYGVTWERPDAEQVHYKGLYDDKGRLMAVICHNTDLGDGWEREGDNEIYFRVFSEKKAYPLGINIVFYAMTH
ncbi:MAG: DUF4159 domain-containing protein [Verrucomicrobia bacterium]|nr:DUF4159 domain-containing protein [Verrucomicrobiota bacterium]